VLGLAPNVARISVRFWQVGTIAEFAGRIRQHFEDLTIIKPATEPTYYSLFKLLKYVATLDDSKNVPPNLAGDFMRAILAGTPYPATLLQAALRRIHSDTENRVKLVRAALIKAYLNRYHRFHPNPQYKEIAMSLDEENPSLGYQLGRLFAVLEKSQRDALGKDINSTIVDRYYSSASSTPAVVFPILMRLNQHHLSKIENPAIKGANRKRIESIMGKIGDFKPHLDLHEQGRFAIGYYHQRQDFFTKKDDANNSQNS
jgi:CRISPR-associated protein Csd1